MKAVNHYVIVEKIKSEQKNIAGLIIHEKIDQEKKYGKAKVISVGNKTEVVAENDGNELENGDGGRGMKDLQLADFIANILYFRNNVVDTVFRKNQYPY